MSAIGGFTGSDALLALATLQQGNWNEQMSDAMSLAKTRSEMASDLANIKSHLESAGRNPARLEALEPELQAFMAKYGSVPELEEVTSAVGEITGKVNENVAAYHTAQTDAGNGYSKAYADWEATGRHGNPPVETQVVLQGFSQEQVDNWLQLLTDKLDATGTNDQLGMIYIKQLNDNINNNSGMVSGIIESRNNATASILNNIA